MMDPLNYQPIAPTIITLSNSKDKVRIRDEPLFFYAFIIEKIHFFPCR